MTLEEYRAAHLAKLDAIITALTDEGTPAPLIQKLINIQNDTSRIP